MNVKYRATRPHSQLCVLEVKSYLVILPPFLKQTFRSVGLCSIIDEVANSEDPPLVYQVDEILVAIDSLNPEELSNQGFGNPLSNFIGGFGVFNPNENACEYLARYAIEFPTTSHARTFSYEAIQPLTPLVDQQNVQFGEISVTEAISDHTAAITAQASDETACLYPFAQIAQIAKGEAEAQSQQIERLNSLGSRDDNLDHFQQLDFSSAASSPIIHQPLSPRYLSPNEHLLLQYYTTRVVHIFPALDSPKSPWVTFHLPRVLQSVGEIAVRGTTSQVRAALRSTLLSISAFFLSKHMRSQSRSEDSTKWETEAMHFHGAAMNLLKGAVNEKFTSQERPKYKELLATMLSMVSINASPNKFTH
jgi:arginine metabolism regulation protein II